MRIADIIARYADQSTTVVDATSEQSGLANYCVLPESLGIQTVHCPAPSDPCEISTERALVIQHHAELDGSERDLDRVLSRYGDTARGIFMLSGAGDFARYSVVERATSAGYEIISLHQTDHRHYKVAVVIGPPAEENKDDLPRLRGVNEYRCMAFDLRLARSSLAAATERVGTLTKALDAADARRVRELAERDKELEQLRRELASERAASQGATREKQTARRAAEEAAARSKELERKLSLTHKKMVTARTSLSFRIGRATKLALQGARKNPLRLPKSWVTAFREPSGLPPGFTEGVPTPSAAPAAGALSDEERTVLARRYWMLDRTPAVGARPGIAGVVGARLGAELAFSTRFTALEPNAWRYQLEAENPAFVLVTSCGLAAGSPWSTYGTVGGRGSVEALVALSELCALTRTPFVYWDTVGANVLRLGIPSAVTFDAVFSVSPARCRDRLPGGAEPQLLGPAVEPRLYNPIGVGGASPSTALYAGAFDQRMGRDALDALTQALEAARDTGLEIHDPHWGYQGQLAAALEFPESLRPLCKRRDSAEAEARALRSAGLAVCASQVAEADFVPWSVLRAVACGAHVVCTQRELPDEDLRGTVTVVATADEATDAVAALAARPRMDRDWKVAFDRVVADYSLADRIRAIADHVGARGAVPRAPKVSALDAGADASAAEGATHVVLAANGDGPGEATLAELERLARVSGAEVVALTNTADNGSPPYSHGTLPPDAVAAVRVDALRGDGGWPASAIDELVVAGAKVFVMRPPSGEADAAPGGDQ